jgi:hypothetical protein
MDWWFDHGLGDCVQFATVLQLYRRRGHTVNVHCEHNKLDVFRAAGCDNLQQPKNYHHWRYSRGFNEPRADVDGSGNKTFNNLGREQLTLTGSQAEMWEEICQVNLEDSFDPLLTDAVRAEARRFVADLPRPIVLLHTRGTNFANDKSLPDDDTTKLYRLLLDGMGGSLVLLDWDNRVPRPAHGRIRHTKRDWGHLTVLQLVALMGEADLLIGIDSGPYHLAAMTRLPALGVFHHFYPSCVTLPRPTLKNAVMTRNADTYRPVNQARRRRWSVLEYGGHMPPPADVARHALRMLAGPRYGLPVGRDVMLQQFVRDWLRASTSTSEIADRNTTMDWLFREIDRRFPAPEIVETGCVRSREDWSAGYSSYLFAMYLDGKGAGKLTSVDLSGGYCRIARDLLREFGAVAEVVESDSVVYLRGRERPIDVLYLDSLDCEDPRHAAHGLAEAQAAERLLGETSIVVFDDSPRRGNGWAGKGAEAIPYLVGRGWRVHPTSGYQAVLVR